MPFKGGGASAVPAVGDWFYDRFTRARALVPDAGFDTILGNDFEESITTEAVETSGVFSSNPTAGGCPGGITLTAGDGSTGGSLRWQPTGCAAGAHQRDLTAPWYAAALCLPAGNVLVPTYAAGGFMSAVELRLDDNNRVRLGLVGTVDASHWVMQSVNAGAAVQDVASIAIGALALWRLFELWHDPDVGMQAAVDGVAFGTIATAAVPAVAATISCLVARGAPIDPGGNVPIIATWDKFALVTTSPAPGSA